MKDLLPQIKNRSSVQLYDEDRAIEPDKLSAVLEAARLAPSAVNNQPWRYIVVQDKETRRKLVKALHAINFWAGSAPGLIVQISQKKKDFERGKLPYFMYDCGLSVMSLILEAEHQGLRCRQMAAYDDDKVRQVLDIPSQWSVIIVVAIGYAGDLKRDKPNLLKRWGTKAFSRIESRLINSKKRKKMEEIVSYDRF